MRVVKVDAATGPLTTDTVSADRLSGLGSEEKALLLKLLDAANYTGSSAQDDVTALKKLWDTAPPTPLPEPDIIPVQKVALSQHSGAAPAQLRRPQRLHHASGRHRPDGALERFAGGRRLGGGRPRHRPQEGHRRRHRRL